MYGFNYSNVLATRVGIFLAVVLYNQCTTVTCTNQKASLLSPFFVDVFEGIFCKPQLYEFRFHSSYVSRLMLINCTKCGFVKLIEDSMQ